LSKDRFEFGKNWESYSQLLDETRIRKSEDRLAALLGTRDLSGLTFLDIGCGSGLHSLAALRFGARQVLGIDLDPNSVATTQAVLKRFWRGDNWSARELSVFDVPQAGLEQFDIVYSWGVLHHTGDMNRALRNAAGQVKPGGLFAVALYGKTRYCGMWTRIKRWYVNATPEQQAWAERLYVRLFGFYLLLRGKRLKTHIANYTRKRGMDFYHDVKDWVGGYPYESIAPRELTALLAPLGFELVNQKVHRRSGLFGSGNDEFLLRKGAAPG
jgi:2-polyprenyl-6-hydroxyphenyl methylase/3-demethylubiquinone-9 3-methyltransferase